MKSWSVAIPNVTVEVQADYRTEALNAAMDYLDRLEPDKWCAGLPRVMGVGYRLGGELPAVEIGTCTCGGHPLHFPGCPRATVLDKAGKVMTAADMEAVEAAAARLADVTANAGTVSYAGCSREAAGRDPFLPLAGPAKKFDADWREVAQIAGGLMTTAGGPTNAAYAVRMAREIVAAAQEVRA